MLSLIVFAFLVVLSCLVIIGADHQTAPETR